MKIGPELHRCEICGNSDMAPDIAPYLLVEGKGHVWLHPACKMAAVTARNAKQGPLKFPEAHEVNDGQ